jgi:hypothetical protein
MPCVKPPKGPASAEAGRPEVPILTARRQNMVQSWPWPSIKATWFLTDVPVAVRGICRQQAVIRLGIIATHVASKHMSQRRQLIAEPGFSNLNRAFA